MSVGIPVGVAEDEVGELASAAAAEALDAVAAALFRTGTNAKAAGPSVGEAFVFTTGADQIVGEGIVGVGNGRYRLSAGTYFVEGVVRSGNYSNPTGLIVWQWKNFEANDFFGNQAIHYANASTSMYTHQPYMAGLIVVPEGETRDIGAALVGLTGGLNYIVSEARSSLAIKRLA